MAGRAGVSPSRQWFLAVLVDFPLQHSRDAAAPRPELLLFIEARILQDPLRETGPSGGRRRLAGGRRSGGARVGEAVALLQQNVRLGVAQARLALAPQALPLVQAELLDAVVDEAGRGLLVGHGHLAAVQDFELLRVVEGILAVFAGLGILFHGGFGQLPYAADNVRDLKNNVKYSFPPTR